jgi:hypothetical protein
LTVLDGQFWAEYFKTVFAKQISLFCMAVETRLLPTFDDLDREAEREADSEWERLGRTGDPESADPGELAERAQDAGIEYYASMDGVRQTLINLSVAALYHLLEQQLLVFHRQQVLHPREENDASLMSITELDARLSRAGIEIKKFDSWAKVDELKAVTNAVKHAEGRSAEELRQLRPDLFIHPQLRETATLHLSPPSPVYLPLAGEDIFLTAQDLQAYCSALLAFWAELGKAIRA